MGGNFNISRFKNQIAKQGGLSRGLFFVCNITHQFSSSFKIQENELLLCKAVTLPANTLDVAEIKYFTRAIRIPASRQFVPITLTFYNTNNHSLYNQFINWMDLLSSYGSNARGENYRGGKMLEGTVVRTDTYTDLFAELTLTSYNNTGKLSPNDITKLLLNSAVSFGQSVASQVNPILGTAASALNSKLNLTQNLESNNKPTNNYWFYDVYPVSISGLQFSYDDDGSYQTYDVEFQYRYASVNTPNSVSYDATTPYGVG